MSQVPGNHVLGVKPILAIFVESILGSISANLYSILVIGHRGDIVLYKYIEETSHASIFI